jgi:hypothetical protein
MVALIKGARDLQPKTYLNPEHFAIFEKYTGAKESEIRTTTPVTYTPDLPSTRRAYRIRKSHSPGVRLGELHISGAGGQNG